MMRLTVVGSGTAAPHPTRVAAGHLVELDGARVLFDCGNGVVHRLAALGIEWAQITHVAITHYHNDHTGDLPALIAAFRWGQLPPRTDPLVLIGPAGFRGWLEELARPVGSWLLDPETYEVRVVECPVGRGGENVAIVGPAAQLTSLPVPHTPESVAYSLSSARARFVYTGDTPYDETLAEWAAECDVLLTECSLPAALGIPGHLTPDSAGALAARVRPGRLVLTHFYPPVEHDDIVSLVQQRWAGPVTLAQDGTVVVIEDEQC